MEFLEIGIDNAIAISISSKITEGDMALALNQARAKAEAHEYIVFFVQLNHFKGVEVAAIIEELKYLFDVGTSNISKYALLTDTQWFKKILSIEDKIFKNIDIKCFPLEEKDAAIEFLKTHDSESQ